MFPASAGMIPVDLVDGEANLYVPRKRGDDPKWSAFNNEQFMMFPASAGMILWTGAPTGMWTRCSPQARG